MKKIFLFLLVMVFLAGCTSNVPEKANATKKEPVVNEQQSEDKYIQVSVESANSLTESVSKLKALLDNMDIKNEEWQSDVEDSLMQISKAVNDYEMVELDLTEGQSKKFKETKAHYSEGVLSFEDMIQDSRKALETYDKKALEHVRDIQLNQANSLIMKAKEQLEIERH